MEVPALSTVKYRKNIYNLILFLLDNILIKTLASRTEQQKTHCMHTQKSGTLRLLQCVHLYPISCVSSCPTHI